MKAILLLSVFIAFILSHLMGYTPLYVGIFTIIISAATYITYSKDKVAARKSEWRVPESTLHLLGVIGGWPGALIAQEKLRHKTKKQSFRFVFWLTTIFNLAFFVWLHTAKGSYLIHSVTYKFEYWLVGVTHNKFIIAILLFLTEFRVIIEI